MMYSVTGELVHLSPKLPLKGDHYKRTIVVREDAPPGRPDIRPHDYAVDFLDGRPDNLGQFRQGDRVQADFFINCREYGGKWFASLNGYKLTLVEQARAASSQRGPIPQIDMTAPEDAPF